jgi:hypothetical protein
MTSRTRPSNKVVPGDKAIRLLYLSSTLGAQLSSLFSDSLSSVSKSGGESQVQYQFFLVPEWQMNDAQLLLIFKVEE